MKNGPAAEIQTRTKITDPRIRAISDALIQWTLARVDDLPRGAVINVSGLDAWLECYPQASNGEAVVGISEGASIILAAQGITPPISEQEVLTYLTTPSKQG